MAAISTVGGIAARRVPIATIAVCALAIAVSLSRHAAPEVWDWISANLFADGFAVFGGAYWLVATTAFIHLIVPHLTINVVTMALYGSVAERHFSSGTTLGVFFAGAVFSMIELVQEGAILYGSGVAFGMSGGVCAVFGFLCVVHKPMLHPTSWRHWLLILFYPAILVWLFSVEIRGITPTGTMPHIAGLVIGGLIGWAAVSGSLIARAMPVFVLALAVGSLVWSPWALPWQAAHGLLPTLEVGAAAPPLHGGRAKGRVLFFVNSGSAAKLASWVDDDGREHSHVFTTRVSGYPVQRTARADWSLPTTTFETYPHGISEQWVVRDGNGHLIAGFDLTNNPHRGLVIDLGR
jgi:membrane associated rhomboid family serine protease